MNWLVLLGASAAERGQWLPDGWFGLAWVLLGFCAQAVFGGRFLVQWIASERRGKSYVPLSFWYLSLVGGVMLLVYAVHKRDAVFTMGQMTGCVVYIRNLMLLRNEKRSLAQTSQKEAPGGDG